MVTRLYWTAFTAWHLLGQARYPWSSPERIARDRDRNVRRMVRYAYRWAPYYRETMDRLGLAPDDFRGADDLRRLPPVEVRALQREPERFRSGQFGERDLLPVGSGGSTGEPHYVWHNTAALLQSAAHSQRDLAIATALIGKPSGYRHVSLGSPRSTAVEVRHFTRQMAIYPPREPVQRLSLSLGDPPEVNLPLINAFEPDLITGYGSYFGRLFGYIRDSDAPFHRPKVIVYSSESVPVAAQRIISEDFGIPLFGLYQAIEAFKMGFECEARRGYHINIDNYVLRVVNEDGQDVSPGETGEVLVSNLVNRGTVLLNMRLGDMARWLPPEPCPCGRTLPLLDFIQGRSQEWIRLPDGMLLHPQLIAAVLFSLSDIHRYQAVQLAPDRFEVRLVTVAGVDQEALAERARRAFEDKVGHGVRFDIRFVDELVITASGKTRALIGLGGDGLTAYLGGGEMSDPGEKRASEP
jgi:phenylacetate-CoA ligase